MATALLNPAFGPSIYWRYRRCGHVAWTERRRGGYDAAGNYIAVSEDQVNETNGQCADCRARRVGETIEFVRYGRAPDSGLSRDHRDDVLLEGVSVYEVVDGKRIECGWDFDISARGTVIRGRAKIVGWGSDGEPLVDWSTMETIE